MKQSDTIERILNSASALFAEHGYSETSLRTITSAANVNLAAVNYHFGSKRTLIEAVFNRFMEPFCECLNRSLDECQQDIENSPSMDKLTRILFNSFFESMALSGSDPQQFMRLLGLAYSQSQGFLRHSVIEHYGDTYNRYMYFLKIANPDVDPVAFYWRLFFMMGATIFTLSSYESINDILKADFNRDSTMSEVVDLMVPSLSALMQGNKD
jgi:AcrR family transcriptional regulator